MAPLHEKYELRVTAGSTYDRTKHRDVLVNTEKPLHISSDLIDAQIHVRVKDFRGTYHPLPNLEKSLLTM